MLSSVDAARKLLLAGEPTSVTVAELMAWRELARRDAEQIVRVVARDLGMTTTAMAPSTLVRSALRRREHRQSRVALRLL